MSKNCEQKIMEVLLPVPFEAHSVRGISKIIKVDYSLVHKSVKKLIEKRLIKTKKIGKSLSCQLNLSADPQLLAISSLIYSQKLLNKAKFGFIIDEIKNKLNDLIYIMVLFGSHAKGTAKKDSEIDLLFVVQNEADINKTKKRIESVTSETKLKIEFEVITAEWFIKMFNEKHTVGREVLEASIILRGADQYYSMVKAYDKKRGH